MAVKGAQTFCLLHNPCRGRLYSVKNGKAPYSLASLARKKRKEKDSRRLAARVLPQDVPRSKEGYSQQLERAGKEFVSEREGAVGRLTDRYSEAMFFRNEHEKLRFTSTFTDILEEAGEPLPKKIKIDRSNLNFEEEQQQFLQRLYYTDKKSSNKTLCFSQVLCNVNQKGLELQDGNTTNLITSTRPYEHFKLCVDVNLQSRMFRNIQFYEKCIIENTNLVTNPESWALHAKEKPIEIGRSWSELATVNLVPNDIWAENLITRIEPLLKDAPVYQSNENGTDCLNVHAVSISKALYQVIKPVTVYESSGGKILPFCFQARSFMKGNKSDLVSLFYTNKSVNENGNILLFPKQTRCPANNNFRGNKEFQNLYKLYSRKCERLINPKLVKFLAFELLLQDKRGYNCSTANEKNDISIFSQRTTFNIQLKAASKESSSKKYHIFSKVTVEGNNTFSIDDNEKEKKARQHALYDKQILQANNIHSFFVSDTIKKEEDLTAHSRHLSTFSSVPNIFEKLSIKHSSLKMMATMVTCTQKNKMKDFSKNNVFSLKKFKTLHFVLRANNKCKDKRSRNSINFVRKRKYVPRYLETCSRTVTDKRKYSDCEDVGSNHCSSVAAKTPFSLETFNKIPLNDDCEELDQISLISKVIFNYKNMDKYSKRCTATASRIAYNGHDARVYFLPKLLFPAITNYNCLLVQESKSKSSQYPNDFNTSSQVLKQNSIAFPSNGPNSRNILSFTSVVFHDLCIAQNTTIGVKTWHSMVTLFGHRRKNSCIFDIMKSVLQDEPVCRSQGSNSLKNLKVENMKILLKKGFFPSSTCRSEPVVSVKQNADYFREIGNATVEKIYTSKRNQHQNLILPYLKNESAKIIGSEDRLMELSCTMTREHFEDVTEKHLPSKFKNNYEFEMNRFDLVLKELNGFNDISNGNKNSLLHEQRNIIQEDSHELSCLDSVLQEDSKNIDKNKENVTFSTCGSSLSYTMVNQNKNGQIIFKDTRLKSPGEQEVPHEDCSRILDEELFYPTPEECFDSGCKQPLPWNPAFVSCTSMEERSYSLQGEQGKCFSDGIIRVQPLKTCHGPLRVGLSRKAKPKQLHPYLK